MTARGIPARWGREYSAREVEFIRANFTRLGAARIAARLNRPKNGITRMAAILDVPGRVIPETARRSGWITLDEASNLTGAAVETIRQRAVKQTQLRTWGGTRRLPAISGVKRSWLDTQTWTATAGTKSEFAAAGWLDTTAAAAYCGLKRGTLHAAVTHARLPVPLRSAFVATGSAPKRMFHPQDVEALRVALDAERHASTQLVILKVLAAEVGVSLPTMTARANRAGIERRILLTKWGVRMAHVTPADAERLAS